MGEGLVRDVDVDGRAWDVLDDFDGLGLDDFDDLGLDAFGLAVGILAGGFARDLDL